MDPATLYLLFLMADGSHRLHREHWGTMAACEQRLDWAVARKAEGSELLNAACWPLGGDWPDWANRPIYGVPLMPRDDRFR